MGTKKLDLADDALESIRKAMRMDQIRIPNLGDSVFKDECIFSFDTPYSPDGLFLNLKSFQGFGLSSLKYDTYDKQRVTIYLNILHTKVLLEKCNEGNESKEVQKLAIGVEGGFLTDSQKYTTIKNYYVGILNLDVSDDIYLYEYPDKFDKYPFLLNQSIEAIISHKGASEQAEVDTWEANLNHPISKYAETLSMEENGIKISNDPSNWKCEDSGVNENLWLNLGTGYIGSGRQNWDGTGGNGAALRHYQQTGKKYPLVVKLGTITPQGADVYSYAEDEDCMVKDPQLAEHLSRWGIDIMKQQKTEKTIAEMEVELNKSYDFSKITEAGCKLTPLYGPGYTGLKNLGNSCYMNSCIQILCALPEIEEKYEKCSFEIFTKSLKDPTEDFTTQMSKLVSGLLSGKYSKPPDESIEGKLENFSERNSKYVEEIAPVMFRKLIGKSHPEFSTGRQQDAVEYMIHLIDQFSKFENNEPAFKGKDFKNTSSHFQFKVEDRQECLTTKRVKYRTGPMEPVLTLKIPIEEAVNKEELKAFEEREAKKQKMVTESSSPVEEVRPLVAFKSCLENFGCLEYIENFEFDAKSEKGMISKRQRMMNFPKYLLVQLGRYVVTPGEWVAKKLDAEVDVPEIIDLNFLRANGPQIGECVFEEKNEEKVAEKVKIVPSEAIVSQLLEMGLNSNGSQKAALATNNLGAEAAMEWYFSHSNDPDFELPIDETEGKNEIEIDSNGIKELMSYGFQEKYVMAALKTNAGNQQKAAELLFNSMDNLESIVASSQETSKNKPPTSEEIYCELSDGDGKYQLVGFVSHIGKQICSGHYVAHIKRDGKWVIYDDTKVALSEATPFRHGYMYLYSRLDG